MDAQTTRRAFIGAGAALAPALVLGATIPAAALAAPACDPARTYTAVLADFCAGRVGEDAYDAAHEALADWEPATTEQFTRKVLCLFGDGGFPEADIIEKLLAQGARLLGDKA